MHLLRYYNNILKIKFIYYITFIYLIKIIKLIIQINFSHIIFGGKNCVLRIKLCFIDEY